MRKTLLFLVGCLALVAVQAQEFDPETRDAATIKADIEGEIANWKTALEMLNANNKEGLRNINATLEMERTKADLEAYISTDSTSDYVILANLLKEASDFINNNLKKMTIRLASMGGFFSILAKPIRKDLTDDLNALKKEFDAYLVHYNKVKNAFECRLAKKCYAEDLEAAEGEFYDMWNAVERLKLQCRTFDADCIMKFMQYKTMFETFESDKIPGLRAALDDICDKKCYANDDEQFSYEKSLLTLDISASGMVAAVQFAVKHAIVKRLNSITKKMHIRKEKLNIYKLSFEDAVTKDELSAALVNLRSLKLDASEDAYSFEEVFMLAIGLEGKLSKEDFDHIKKQATAMMYRLDGLKKQINECIEKVESSHAFIAFKIEVNENEAVLLTNADKLKERIRRVKEGRHRLCTETVAADVGDVTLVDEFEELRLAFVASGVEFEHLHSLLNKDFKDSSEFDALEAAIKQFKITNMAKMKEAEKYKFFLHVYSKTYCN